MKRLFAERNLVILLFILVFISFAIADRASKKLQETNLYRTSMPARPAAVAGTASVADSALTRPR